MPRSGVRSDSRRRPWVLFYGGNVKISAILSDIGEVVAPFDNQRTFRALAEFSGLPVERVQEIIMVKGLPLLDQYERGEVSTDQFQKIVCSRLNLAKREMPTPQAFFKAYADVFTLRYDVLARWCHLRARGIALVAVSNICEMRYERLAAMGTFDVFDHEIMSFKEGHRKPSVELMVRALDRAGCKAEEALFVDDLEPNLGPAKELGMQTHHFTTAPELFAFLETAGVK